MNVHQNGYPMTLPPDQLFRDRLGNFQKKAPATAWDRIETRLDRKQAHIPWLKMAAGLLLLLATSILLWQPGRNPRVASASPIYNRDIAPAGHLPVEQKPGDPPQGQIGATLDHTVTHAKKAVTKHPKPETLTDKSSAPKPHSLGKEALPAPSQESLSGNLAAQTETQEAASIPVAKAESANIQSDALTEAAPNRASITYTAEQVEAKFLKKENPSDATPDRKNTSGLQKVVAVALDFKYEESLVGELRDIKNEWLSFNPPSKKRQLNK